MTRFSVSIFGTFANCRAFGNYTHEVETKEWFYWHSATPVSNSLWKLICTYIMVK